MILSKREKFRNIYNSIFLILFIFIFFNPQKCRSEISVNIKEGFDKHYRAGKWTPLIIEMDNTTYDKKDIKKSIKNLRGDLILKIQTSFNKQIAYSRDFELPQNSKKKFFMYAKIPDLFSNANLTIRDENKNIVSKSNLVFNHINFFKSLILIITDESSFSLPELFEKNIYQTVTVSPEDIPDLKFGLDSVDMIILPAAPEKFLNEDQKESLINWIIDGGVVICFGGTKYQTYQNSFLKQYLPVIPEDITSLELEQNNKNNILNNNIFTTAKENNLQKFPINIVKNNGGQNLYSIENYSIISLKNVGLGKIYFCAFEPQPTLNQNISFLEIWNGIFPFRKTGNNELFFWDKILQRFQYGLTSIVKPPSALFISLLLIIYLIFVGPGNYFLLKKIKKLELSWFTIPFIVFVFTLAFYFYGSARKGKDFFIWEFTKMKISSDNSIACCDSVYKVFSPRNSVISLNNLHKHSVLSDFYNWDNTLQKFTDTEMMYNFNYPFISPERKKIISVFSTKQDPSFQYVNKKIELKNMPISQWSDMSIQSDYFKNIDGTISGYADFVNNNINIDIYNKTGITISNSFAACGKYIVYIGEIKPYSEQSYVLKNIDNDKLQHIYSSLSDSKQDKTLKENVIKMYIPLKDSIKIYGNFENKVYLNGWVNQSKSDFNINISAKNYFKNTFIQLPLKWRNINSQFEYFTGQTNTYLINTEGGEYKINNVGLEIFGNTEIYLMSKPIFEDCNVYINSLKVNFILTEPNPDKIEILIFNFKKYYWEKLVWNVPNKLNDMVSIDIPNSSDFITKMNGRIFFKIKNINDKVKYFGRNTIQLFTVSMSGKTIGGNSSDRNL